MRTVLQLGLLAVLAIAVAGCAVSGAWSIDLDLDPSPLLELQQGTPDPTSAPASR